MIKLLKKLPLPIAGLMLALATTGNLVMSYGPVYRNLFGTLSAVLFALLLIKIILNADGVKESLNNPVIASVSPTFSMGTMLLATYLKPFSNSLALTLWCFGLGLHVALILWFSKTYMLGFNIKKVFPSYFVVYVGIVVGSITAPAFNLIPLGAGLFWFGFVSYIALLPVVLYRVFSVKQIPEPALPTLAIFAAPASLCLAGYLSTHADKNMVLVTLMAMLSFIMFTGVLLYLPKLLKLKFYPSFSALTFPLAISAVAMKKATAPLVEAGLSKNLMKYFVNFQELLTVAVVLYVLVKYMQFLAGSNAPAAQGGPVKKSA